MAHTHDVYDMENHFEINGSSRFIKETSETKLVVVQGDHKSEVLTFKMPRYIDGHDMTLCNKIRIHYINLDTKTNNKSADVYEVTDLTLCEECEDVLTFTWTIEAPATKYSGTLSFLVKFECTEGENVLYQWNTAKYVSVNVLAGIDNSEEFVDKYSNVLEEWYNELTRGADSIEELNQQALAEIELAKEDAKEDIQGKADATMAEMNQFSSNAYNSFKNDVNEKAAETLESIPDDYEELDKEVKKIKENFTPSDNVFDLKEITENAYIASNGEVKIKTTESSEFVSGKIFVKSGDVLYAQEFNYPNFVVKFISVAEYSEDGTFIKISHPNASIYTVENDGYILFYASKKLFFKGEYDPKTTVSINKELERYVECKYFLNEKSLEELADSLNEDFNRVTEDVEKNALEIANIKEDLSEVTTSLEKHIEESGGNILAFIPPITYGVVGQELNIYFDNLVDGHDTDYRFDVEVLPVNLGKQFERCYRIVPNESQIGEHNLYINITKGSSTLKLLTKLIITSETSNSGVNKKVLVIGDSTVEIGSWVSKKILNNFENDVMSVELLGTKGTVEAKHEGYSGFSTETFFSNKHPFYNPETNTFDAQYYFEQYGVDIPDWVFIQLGINDVFGITRDSNFESKIEDIMDRYETIISSIKSVSEDIKIGVSVTIPPNYSQDSFGVNYNVGQSQYRAKRNIVLLDIRLIEQFKSRESEGIYLIPINTNLDTLYNMGRTTAYPNARNTDTLVDYPLDGSGVHPAESGYWQIADVYWFFLKNQS